MLDISFTLLVEAYVQTGLNTIEAIERVTEFCDGPPEPTAAVAASVPTPAENDAAMDALTKMMMGVSR